MPLSALLMPYRLCLEHFHKTHFHPTFRHEVYSLAAAERAIQIYRAEPVADHIWRYGDALRTGIAHICRDLGIAGGCTGPPFRMQFIFQESDPERRRLKRSLLLQELFKQRVVTFLCMLLPSYAHDDAVLQQTLTAFGNALDVVADAERHNDFHRRLELHLT
jgi:glutamate-1-semialdehyde aminotransferase